MPIQKQNYLHLLVAGRRYISLREFPSQCTACTLDGLADRDVAKNDIRIIQGSIKELTEWYRGRGSSQSR